MPPPRSGSTAVLCPRPPDGPRPVLAPGGGGLHQGVQNEQKRKRLRGPGPEKWGVPVAERGAQAIRARACPRGREAPAEGSQRKRGKQGQEVGWSWEKRRPGSGAACWAQVWAAALLLVLISFLFCSPSCPSHHRTEEPLSSHRQAAPLQQGYRRKPWVTQHLRAPWL